MTRQELLDRANAHFDSRGWPPVTDRQLRDWCDEAIVVGPKPNGRARGLSPEWIWSDEALETVQEIGRLRSLGASRVHQFRSYLWIAGHPVELTRAKRSIHAEFQRMVNGERRRLGDTETSGKMSRATARLNRAGSPDPDLPALPVIDVQGQLALLDSAIWGGNETIPFLLQTIVKALAKLTPGIAGFVAGLPGLLGLADETELSALAAIETASAIELEQARVEVWNIMGLINGAIQTGFSDRMSPNPNALRNKLEALDSPTWAIHFLVTSLNGRRNLARKNRRQIQ